MSDRLKGFIFGALAMLITPALAVTNEPTPQISEPAANPAYLYALTYADAEGAIGHALGDRGAGGKVSASILGKTGENIFSYNKPLNVEIRGLRFDKNGNQWSANLLFLSDDKVVSAKPVSGRFEEMVEVPMLKHQVRAGEVISENNIELRDYPTSRTRNDTVTDIASLVGHAPERVISQGRPIRESELSQPSMVKKNDLVKMHYTTRGMEITADGQAMTDGAQGAVISVRNTASKKIVQARVLNANTVELSPDYTQSAQTSMDNHYAAN